jgi:hypothetical protein
MWEIKEKLNRNKLKLEKFTKAQNNQKINLKTYNKHR